MSDPAAILAIDDSEDDRLLYKRSLKKCTEFGYVVTEAASGEDGLACIDKESFACVLLDYSLPGRNGVEILKRIRAKHPFVPVVMLTGLGNEKVAVAANCATTPRIDTTFEETPDHWLFRVSDNGTGIARQDTDKLFMPFKRMSHQKMQGPGLGLATCRKIIELHGGKIWFETRPANGTDFIFSVAKGEPVVVAQTAVVSSPLMKSRDEGGQELATLLLVDDDDMAIELAQIRLIDANRLHCNVIVAHDGQEALARLHDTKIDLVLLDINMPRMDGFELLARMRDENLLGHTAVVMCSTSTYQDDISKANDLGACGYLTKPPDFSRLRSILESSTILNISEVGDNLHLLRAA